MSAVSVTIGVPVSDLEAACRWCELVLGKSHHIEPVPGIREFRVPGTWLQLDEGPAGGGDPRIPPWQVAQPGIRLI